MTEPRDTPTQDAEPDAGHPAAPAAAAGPESPAGAPEPARPASTSDTAATPAAPAAPQARPRAPRRRSRSGPRRLQRILALVFAVVEVLILVRIALIMVGAPRDNEFVDAVLQASGVLVAPFQGILESNEIKVDNLVIDLAATVALVGWAAVELVLYSVIDLFRRSGT